MLKTKMRVCIVTDVEKEPRTFQVCSIKQASTFTDYYEVDTVLNKEDQFGIGNAFLVHSLEFNEAEFKKYQGRILECFVFSNIELNQDLLKFVCKDYIPLSDAYAAFNIFFTQKCNLFSFYLDAQSFMNPEKENNGFTFICEDEEDFNNFIKIYNMLENNKESEALSFSNNLPDKIGLIYRCYMEQYGEKCEKCGSSKYVVKEVRKDLYEQSSDSQIMYCLNCGNVTEYKQS